MNLGVHKEHVDYVKSLFADGGGPGGIGMEMAVDPSQITHENAMHHLIEHHRKLMARHADLLKQHHELLDKHHKHLSRSTELEEQVKTLSRSGGSGTAKTLDPELAHERRLRLLEKSAILKQKFRPSDVDKLTEKVLGSESKPNIFTLSRAEDSRDCFAGELLDILSGFEAAPTLGEKTKPQIFTMSRELPHGTPSGSTGEPEIDPLKKIAMERGHIPTPAAK